MDMTDVIIYFLGIVVEAFSAEVEERPITFYRDLYYKGESRTMAVSVGTPEGSPCGSCYNFTGDVANQLKFRRPGSIEVPPDHYIRLYEDFDCHGHHITFCGTGCKCSSAHIDLSGENHKCYINNNNIARNFCPGDPDCHTLSGCLKQENCYANQPGLYSFSVHKRPGGDRKLWLEYPSTVLGTHNISFEKCTARSILRGRSTANELCSCDANCSSCDYSTKVCSRDIRIGGVEYCFWIKWLGAMQLQSYFAEFTRAVGNNQTISAIDWSFMAPNGHFFGVRPRYGVYGGYANVLYAVLVKIMTNEVPREHRDALRVCVSYVVDHKLRCTMKERSNYIHEKLRFWKMIKSAQNIMMGIPEGEVSISESEVEYFYHNIDAIETDLTEQGYSFIRLSMGNGTMADRIKAYLQGLE